MMYQRRRGRALLAVLVLVALVLITVDFRSGGGRGEGPLGALRGAASAVLGPIQSGLADLIAPLSSGVSGVTELFSVRSENARLRTRLEDLEERRVSYDDVVRENRELRDLLELAERGGSDTAAGHVIAVGSSNFEWTVTIDVGSNDGVQPEMVVVNGRGLVGRVIQVMPDTARVLLAIDHTFGAAASVAASGEQGTVTGGGRDPLVFEPLDPEASVEPGDEIVTSQYSRGLFPSGIPIGTVTSVDDRSGSLDRRAHVRPFVDFSRLSIVLVVLHAPDFTFPTDDLPDAPADDLRAPGRANLTEAGP